MAALKKYMFDLDFDAIAPEPVAAPEKTVEEGAAEEAPPPTFSEFEVEEAKRIAFAEGQAAGQADAAGAIERRRAEALTALVAGLAKIMAAQQDGIETLRRDAVHLALTVVKKLHPEMARLHGTEEIAGVVRECLMQIEEAARLTIRVHPTLLESVRTDAARVAEEAEFAGKIIYAADPKLALGDCRVEWGNGGADRDQALLWAEIDTIVARAIDGMIAASQTGAPAAS